MEQQFFPSTQMRGVSINRSNDFSRIVVNENNSQKPVRVRC
jgi:hypothetical protein